MNLNLIMVPPTHFPHRDPGTQLSPGSGSAPSFSAGSTGASWGPSLCGAELEKTPTGAHSRYRGTWWNCRQG